MSGKLSRMPLNAWRVETFKMGPFPLLHAPCVCMAGGDAEDGIFKP